MHITCLCLFVLVQEGRRQQPEEEELDGKTVLWVWKVAFLLWVQGAFWSRVHSC